MTLKRSPLRRDAPARAPVETHGECLTCGQVFFRRTSFHRACSQRCAELLVRSEKRQKAAAQRAERVAIRAMLEAMKPLSKLRAEAQAQFNRFIRLRDRKAGYGCICCGEPLDWDSGKPGGAVDAGHYIGRGAATELAFDERNVNAQRKSCNRPGGASRAEFREGMIARHGLAVVEELEGPHELPHRRHDDYRLIRDTYRARANALARE